MCALRVELPGPILKNPKLYFMMRLRETGWVDGAPAAPFALGQPFVYTERLALPTSYFACLWEHVKIFNKNVVEISHGMPNHYYKCLLFLSSTKIQEMLAAIDNTQRDDTWFKKHCILLVRMKRPAEAKTREGASELAAPVCLI